MVAPKQIYAKAYLLPIIPAIRAILTYKVNVDKSRSIVEYKVEAHGQHGVQNGT